MCDEHTFELLGPMCLTAQAGQSGLKRGCQDPDAPGHLVSTKVAGIGEVRISCRNSNGICCCVADHYTANRDVSIRSCSIQNWLVSLAASLTRILLLRQVWERDEPAAETPTASGAEEAANRHAAADSPSHIAAKSCGAPDLACCSGCYC